MEEVSETWIASCVNTNRLQLLCFNIRLRFIMQSPSNVSPSSKEFQENGVLPPLDGTTPQALEIACTEVSNGGVNFCTQVNRILRYTRGEREHESVALAANQRQKTAPMKIS